MFRSSKHGFREIFCFCTFVLSARPYATEGKLYKEFENVSVKVMDDGALFWSFIVDINTGF